MRDSTGSVVMVNTRPNVCATALKFVVIGVDDVGDIVALTQRVQFVMFPQYRVVDNAELTFAIVSKPKFALDANDS